MTGAWKCRRFATAALVTTAKVIPGDITPRVVT